MMVVEEERGCQVSCQFGAWVTGYLLLISNLGVQMRSRIVSNAHNFEQVWTCSHWVRVSWWPIRKWYGPIKMGIMAFSSFIEIQLRGGIYYWGAHSSSQIQFSIRLFWQRINGLKQQCCISWTWDLEVCWVRDIVVYCVFFFFLLPAWGFNQESESQAWDLIYLFLSALLCRIPKGVWRYLYGPPLSRHFWIALRWGHVRRSLKRVEQCFYLHSSRYFTLRGNKAREIYSTITNLCSLQLYRFPGEFFGSTKLSPLVNQMGKAKHLCLIFLICQVNMEMNLG